MRTLVLGGYGNFGARICRALNNDPFIELLVGGRDASRAQELASQLGNAAGVTVDIGSAELPDVLRRLGVGLLIHAAGPFQGQSYDVARAAAAAGVHYIDLADERRFVCDFHSALDGVFRAAGRTAVTGVSTVPALSSAVVDHLSCGWRRVDTIDICIAPAQTAPRGEATLAAVLSYCGEPIKVWDEQRWQSRYGWANPQAVRFERMALRLGALCDVPDLELFPRRYAATRRVMFRAALEVGIAQRAFAGIAGLRRLGLLRRPQRLAGVLHVASKVLDPLGSGLGGMVVAVGGRDASGCQARREWHIAADEDHGPEIPCMPAILLARRICRHDAFPVGAMPCVGLLELGQFDPEFERWSMIADTVTVAEDESWTQSNAEANT